MPASDQLARADVTARPGCGQILRWTGWSCHLRTGHVRAVRPDKMDVAFKAAHCAHWYRDVTAARARPSFFPTSPRVAPDVGDAEVLIPGRCRAPAPPPCLRRPVLLASTPALRWWRPSRRASLGPKARVECGAQQAQPPGAASVGTLAAGAVADGVARFVWTPAADARAPVLVPSPSDVTPASPTSPSSASLRRPHRAGHRHQAVRVTVEVAGNRFGRRGDPRSTPDSGGGPPNVHGPGWWPSCRTEQGPGAPHRVPSPGCWPSPPAERGRAAGARPARRPRHRESPGTELVAEGEGGHRAAGAKAAPDPALPGRRPAHPVAARPSTARSATPTWR